jgi:uncharacterized protein YndB with AHSA1/START domain
MDLKFSVFGNINRPAEAVFEAVADPGQLSRYFTTGGASARLETGTTVEWSFHEFPGAYPVKVVAVDAPRSIVLEWEAGDAPPDNPYDTRVTITFEPLEDRRTAVRIEEEGFDSSPSSLEVSYGNCMGWSQMICALKGYLEFGINLREGMYD